MTQPETGEIAVVSDTVRRWFPGDGHQRPTNREWAIAETIVERQLDRFYPPGTRLVWPHPAWRNRAYLRTQVTRFLVHADIVTAAGLRRVHQRTRHRLRENHTATHPRGAGGCAHRPVPTTRPSALPIRHVTGGGPQRPEDQKVTSPR